MKNVVTSRSQSRSLEMTPFDRSHMTSYWHSVATMVYHFRDNARHWLKITIFSYHTCGRPHWNIAIAFVTEKLEWWVYQMVKKI